MADATRLQELGETVRTPMLACCQNAGDHTERRAVREQRAPVLQLELLELPPQRLFLLCVEQRQTLKLVLVEGQRVDF